MQYWELLGKTGYLPPRPYFFTPVAFFLFYTWSKLPAWIFNFGLVVMFLMFFLARLMRLLTLLMPLPACKVRCGSEDKPCAPACATFPW